MLTNWPLIRSGSKKVGTCESVGPGNENNRSFEPLSPRQHTHTHTPNSGTNSAGKKTRVKAEFSTPYGGGNTRPEIFAVHEFVICRKIPTSQQLFSEQPLTTLRLIVALIQSSSSSGLQFRNASFERVDVFASPFLILSHEPEWLSLLQRGEAIFSLEEICNRFGKERFNKLVLETLKCEDYYKERIVGGGYPFAGCH